MTRKTNIHILLVKIFSTISKTAYTQVRFRHEAPLSLPSIMWLATNLAKSGQPTAYSKDKERGFHLTAWVYHLPHSREGKGAVPLPPSLCLQLWVKVLNTSRLYMVSLIHEIVFGCLLFRGHDCLESKLLI